MRARYHNLFEKTHRFAGWTLLALFWAQTLSLIHDQGQPVLQQPSVWALCVITLSVVSPWLTLKGVKIDVIKPSNHAVTARFDDGDTPFPGSSNAISHTPFGEYHAFANAPEPGESGYRLVISRAGEVPNRLIWSRALWQRRPAPRHGRFPRKAFSEFLRRKESDVQQTRGKKLPMRNSESVRYAPERLWEL
ncbi:hypothetical protein [Rhizobium sp. FKY42]|uniref:hypothetical protein n=1 Tax=Rhizobium sp. FKY42 TaxID=2562310 RepID=UPI0014853B99|nr:hypothetical protein [Rhizobium sp. FKY42]